MSRPGQSSRLPSRSSPKVEAIHAELRQSLLNGVWKAGDRIPTETELAARFECSPGTINKAVALLVHEGLIERGRRTGMRVLRNSAAPALGNGVELDAFAFIYPSERHEGIHRMARGFQDAALERGRRLVMLPTGTDYNKEAEFIGRLAEFDVKGAVVVPLIPTFEDQLHFSRTILNPPIPVIIAGTNLPGVGCSVVQVDNIHAGYAMTRRQIERGARRIGFLCNRAWIGFVRDRYQGYRLALREAGLEEREEWVALHESIHIDFNDPLKEPTQLAHLYLEKAGFAAKPDSSTGADRRSGRNPASPASGLDAVVCADDFLGTGMIRAAVDRGLRVPEDLRVTGMDDYLTLVQPGGVSLTTYHIPYEEIGRTAFRMLEEQAQGATRKVAETLIPGHVVERASG
mgnify:FL=1